MAAKPVYRCGVCPACLAGQSCPNPPIPDPRVYKKSGFKAAPEGGGPAGTFWVKYSKYGVRYQCRYCGKEALGVGRNNHWDYCSLIKARQAIKDAQEAELHLGEGI